jgi:hypothetical protein
MTFMEAPVVESTRLVPALETKARYTVLKCWCHLAVPALRSVTTRPSSLGSPTAAPASAATVGPLSLKPVLQAPRASWNVLNPGKRIETPVESYWCEWKRIESHKSARCLLIRVDAR